MRWMRITAAIAGVVLVLTGCGSDDSSEGSSDEPTTDGPPTEASDAGDTSDDDWTPDEGDPDGGEAETGSGEAGTSIETCPLLPAEAVADATGSAVEVTASSDAGCALELGDEGVTVVVNLTDVIADFDEYVAGSVDTCDDGTVVEVDAGDRAFACAGPVGPIGWYFDAATSSVVTVQQSIGGDRDLTVEDLAELTALVTV